MAFLGVACAPAKLPLCHCPLWSLLDSAFCQSLLLLSCLPLSRPSSAIVGMAIPGGTVAPLQSGDLLWSCWGTRVPAILRQPLAAVASWSGTPRSYFTFFLYKLVRVCQILLHRIRYFFAFCFFINKICLTSFVFFVLSPDFWLENMLLAFLAF